LKTIIYISILFELLFFSIESNFAQDKTMVLTRKVEQQFTKYKRPLLFINTERGIISVKGWSHAEIKVVLKLTAKNVNVDIARKELNYMTYSITETYNSVYVNNRMVLEQPNQEVSSVILAEYEIFVPYETNIHVDNRFGKLEITDVKGLIEGELHYSDLTLNRKSGPIAMLITIGDFNCTKSKLSGTLTTRHSNISISETSGKLRLETEYGNMNISYGVELLRLSILSNATIINIENKNCHSLDLSLTGEYCPLKMSGNCYTPVKQYLNSDNKPNSDQKEWKLNYQPPEKPAKLIINAKFGSLNMY
jgi:hypothetical protein